MNARVNLYLAMAWAVCVSLSTVAAVSNCAAAGLLEAPGPDADPPPRVVRFNDAGKAWLAEHSAAAGDAA